MVISASRLDGILELVEESLDVRELRGEDLARRAYLSRYHFDRLVRAALGEAPGEFRRRLQLERAAYALSGTADTVIEIAHTAGFRSSEAFTRAFKRAYGATPTGYRGGSRQQHALPAPSGIHFHRVASGCRPTQGAPRWTCSRTCTTTTSGSRARSWSDRAA